MKMQGKFLNIFINKYDKEPQRCFFYDSFGYDGKIVFKNIFNTEGVGAIIKVLTKKWVEAQIIIMEDLPEPCSQLDTREDQKREKD